MDNSIHKNYRYRGVENLAIPLAAILFLIGKEIMVMHRADMPVTLTGYLTYLLEIATFFVNLVWLAPLAFSKNRKLLFLVCLLALLVAHHLLRCILAYDTISQTHFTTFVLSADRIMLTLWQIDRPLFLSFLIVVLQAINQRKLERQQLQIDIMKVKEENARIESTMAQMQLSPHLLLNGLSHLEAITAEKVPEAATAIELMGEMLRPTLINHQKIKMVPLFASVTQINNRIAFEQLVTTKKIYVTLESNITKAESEPVLPPSLLMPAIENVLKYGDLNLLDTSATIQVWFEDGILKLTTWNLKSNKAVFGTGLGLQSMVQILNYYYPQRHQLTVVQNENEYTFKLTINL